MLDMEKKSLENLEANLSASGHLVKPSTSAVSSGNLVGAIESRSKSAAMAKSTKGAGFSDDSGSDTLGGIMSRREKKLKETELTRIVAEIEEIKEAGPAQVLSSDSESSEGFSRS